MEKNILVVDDDSYKLGHIVRALNNDFDNPNIIAASSRNDGLLKMIKCPNIDLIILDWNFPINEGGLPEYDMGEEFLCMMEHLNINIDVIICSSQEVETYHKNVIGTILYNPMQELSFKSVIGRSR